MACVAKQLLRIGNELSSDIENGGPREPSAGREPPAGRSQEPTEPEPEVPEPEPEVPEDVGQVVPWVPARNASSIAAPTSAVAFTTLRPPSVFALGVTSSR